MNLTAISLISRRKSKQGAGSRLSPGWRVGGFPIRPTRWWMKMGTGGAAFPDCLFPRACELPGRRCVEVGLPNPGQRAGGWRCAPRAPLPWLPFFACLASWPSEAACVAGFGAVPCICIQVSVL